MLALLSSEGLSQRAFLASDEFRRIAPDVLAREATRVFKSAESDYMPGGMASDGGGEADGSSSEGEKRPTKTPGLDQFTIGLTAKAKSGGIDPVLGREAEVRQIVDILTRRRQNNPILTGEAGVKGKTAVVEGFAAIASGDVPEPLKNVQIRSLDLGLTSSRCGCKR